jgi:hypothetical protein
METAKISTRQEIAEVLGISGAPRLTFCLETNIASVLQKGSPYPIPLEIRAIPQWTDTSECIANFPQTVSINCFALAIRSISSTIAFATGAVRPATVVREGHSKTRTILAEYSTPKKTTQRNNEGIQCETQPEASPFDKHSSSSGSPLTLPIGHNSSPLHLEHALNLKLQHDQSQFHEKFQHSSHTMSNAHTSLNRRWLSKWAERYSGSKAGIQP